MHVLLVLSAVIVAMVRSTPIANSCSHNGVRYMSGQTVLVGTCDECTCVSGEIVCPEVRLCQRECLHKGTYYEHDTAWADECRKCRCQDGTIFCDQGVCEGQCAWQGMVYEPGQQFDKDCNTCTCGAGGNIHCTEKICHCVDNSGIIRSNGAHYDEDCKSCKCVAGQAFCQGPDICEASCVITDPTNDVGFKVKHMQTKQLGCLVFMCIDGQTVLKARLQSNC